MDINLSYGDSVERANLDWIRSTLPEYEVLWARFIGHDGKGSPLSPEGLATISEAERESFFQAHYTVLLCLLALRDLSDEYQDHQGEANSVATYLKATREVTSFMAHLGRLRDMFKKMDGALKLGNSVWTNFNDFYSQRNSSLHGPMPPHKFADGLIQIPLPSEKAATSDTWTDEGKWTNADQFTYKFVADFFRETSEKAVALCRGGISKCISQLRALEPATAKPMQVPDGTCYSSDEFAVSGQQFSTSSYMSTGGPD